MKNCGCTPPRIHVWLAGTEKSPLSSPLSLAEKGMQKQKSIISSKGLLRPKTRASLSDRVVEVRYGAALGQFSV